MSRSADCIFCKIAMGEAPCYKVYENDRVLAFMDIHPASEGHVLVIPKHHFDDVYDVSNEAAHAVVDVLRKIAVAIKLTLKPDGLNIVQANGEAAGQTVFHYHVHLLPRTAGKKLNLQGARRGDAERLRELAERLKDRLESD